MRSRFVRYISVLVVVALPIAAMGIGPSFAATGDRASLDPRTTPPDQRPLATPSVTARADREGPIEISWHKAPKNAELFQVLRKQGDTVENLTPKGVRGDVFVDSTAVAGVAYTYTVKVLTVRDIPVNPKSQKRQYPNAKVSKASVGDVLGSADVTAGTPQAEEASTDEAAKAAKVKAAQTETRPTAKEVLDKHRAMAPKTAAGKSSAPGGVGSLAHISPSCTVSGAIAADTTWSPASCGDGYFIAGDTVVNVAVTLTLAPGTKLFFSTGIPTVTNTAEGSVDGKVDLIVHGILNSNGTEVAPVVMTSANSDPEDSSTDPSPGDWGTLNFHGTHAPATTTSGTLTWTNISYGTGVVQWKHATPISNSTVRMMSGSTGSLTHRDPTDTYNAHLDYYDPPASTTVSIDKLTFQSENSNNSIFIYSATSTVNGVSANISNSKIEGYAPITIYDDSLDNNASVNVNITNNEIVAKWGDYAIDVEAYEDDDVAALGTAVISGLVSGNKVTDGTDDNYGFYGLAQSSDSGATHAINFANNTISTYYAASENYAYASEAGDANVAYSVTNGQYRSQSGDAWYDYAEAYGTGDAYAGPIFSNVYLNSTDDYGLYVEAYANEGTSQAVPSVSNSKPTPGNPRGIFAYSEAVYLYADSDGDATSRLTLTDSYVESTDSDGIDAYAYSDLGNANATAFITRSNVRGDSYGFYSYVYSYNGVTGTVASSSPSVTDSTFFTQNSENFYTNVYHQGFGDAISSPTITRSTLESADDGGMDLNAYATEANATVSPLITDSKLQHGADDSLDLYARAYGDGAATVAPVLLRTTATNQEDSIMDLYADSDGEGAASVVPQITDSALRTYDDDVIEGDSYSNGAADATTSPMLLRSTMEVGEYQGFDLNSYSYGDGDAITAPSLNASSVRTQDDDAFDLGTYAYGDGNAMQTPSMTNGSLAESLYYDVFDTYVYSAGVGNAVFNPTVTNSTIRNVYDDYGFDSNADANGTGDALLSGTFTNSTIDSYYGAYYGYVYGGDNVTSTAEANPAFNNSMVRSTYGSGIELYADNNGGSTWVHPSLSFTNLQAPDSYGMDLEAYSYGVTGTAATVAPVVSNSSIDSADGVYLFTYDTGPGLHNGILHTGGSFTNTNIYAKWSYGLESYAYAYDSKGDSIVDTTFVNGEIDSYDGVYGFAFNYGCADEGCGDPASQNTDGDVISNLVVKHTDTKRGLLNSWYGYGFDNESFAYTGAGDAFTGGDLRQEDVNSYYDGAYLYAYSVSGDATLSSTVIDNVIQPSFAGSSGGGVYMYTYSGPETATDRSVVAGNVIRNAKYAGIDAYTGGSDEDIDALIAGNTITDVGPNGDQGISYDASSSTGLGDVVRVVDNVVARTGTQGIELNDVIADVRDNVVSYAGGNGGDVTGIQVNDSPTGVTGRVACNTTYGHEEGIDYNGNDTDEDPVTYQNNFVGVQSPVANTPLNLNTDNSGTTNAEWNWWGTNSAMRIDASAVSSGGGTVDHVPHLTNLACRGGYAADKFGGVHPVGEGVFAVTATSYFSSDVVRALAIKQNASSSAGQSGYVLDHFGGLHPFGAIPLATGGPYFGFAIARDVVFLPDGTGGYVLDGWGGVHPFGVGGADAPAPVTGLPYFPGFDIARRIVLRPDGVSGYILDGWGGLHPFNGAPGVGGIPWTPGQDNYRDVVLNHDGHSGYVVRKNGAVHGFWDSKWGAPPTVTGSPSLSSARALARYIDGSGFVVDGTGAFYTVKSFSAPLPVPFPGPAFSSDTLRDYDGQM